MKTIIFFFLSISLFSTFSFAQNITVTGVEKKKVVIPKPAAKSAVKTKTSPTANKDFWNPETASPVFIVQNIATEKLRVYRRCTDAVLCAHELIFEADMIVGQSTRKQNDPKVFATRLGHFKIAKWTKFYEDKNGKFPAWFKKGYPVVPKGSNMDVWWNNLYAGAYGWFTAQLGPNADEQVIHGTYGWSSDKDAFLKHFRNPFVSFIDDPMAEGATRVENQAISYIRHLADLGTDVLRVYALEGYADQNLTRYQAYKNQRTFWDWVLTNKDAQKDSVSIDRNVQLKKNYIYSDVLEEGRFEIDRYPTGMPYSTTLFGIGAGSGQTGNTYQIKRKQFKGVFLVDEGRFVNYEHPQVPQFAVSGYPLQVLPAYALTQNSSYVLVPIETPDAEAGHSN